MPTGKLHIEEKFEELEKAFDGNFDKLDIEIKAQVRAISLKDYKTSTRINRGEWSQDDIKDYLARTDANQKQFDPYYESGYDTELNRTMFQEFWTDLSEFKKQTKTKVLQRTQITRAQSQLVKTAEQEDKSANLAALPIIKPSQTGNLIA